MEDFLPSPYPCTSAPLSINRAQQGCVRMGLWRGHELFLPQIMSREVVLGKGWFFLGRGGRASGN